MLVAGMLMGALPFALAAAPFAEANADLQAGKADEAIQILNAALKTDPNNGEANNLLCRVEYALEHFDPAAGHCEKAVAANPNNARYHLWLGRALGERASRASFLSAYSLAKRTRSEFETAVKLDPRDAEALSDLGEFYKEAPGAVGGGDDKAQEIAGKLDQVDATRAHELRGSLLEKQKDLAGAEKEFKAAAAGPHAASGWMALASFYRKHERWADMEAAVTAGAAAAAKDRHSATELASGASILIRANRQLEQAAKLLEAYIASPDKTEDTPAFEALTRLAKLRKKMGDAAGAERGQGRCAGTRSRLQAGA